MNRRGQISIDRIVAVRSVVLPFYIIVLPDGRVTAADEVADDGNDFLTTKMYGDQISFQSVRGCYLSAEGGQISTRPYCSADERFTVEKRDMQYAFRSHSGQYLSMQEREPCVQLATSCTETEVFQLFSLMMFGVNVGQQLDNLEKKGMVSIEGLLDADLVDRLRPATEGASVGHEARVPSLASASTEFAQLAVHPVVLHLTRRLVSSRAKLTAMESCRTDADHVRKELEKTTWHVVHPYSVANSPGIVDPRVSLTVTWFLDDLDSSNSTWAYVPAPLAEGAYLPQLPHLSSPEEIDAVARSARPVLGTKGSAWFYLGPVWMSNNVGAASFWRDYDAQTRYKHLSGQKEVAESFRALTNTQRSLPPKEELCPTLVQATYVREYIALRDWAPSADVLAKVNALERDALETMCG